MTSTQHTGDYDGQINFASKDDNGPVCSWEVELQVTSGYTTDPTLRTVCDLTFNMTSELATDATAGCDDVGVGGKLIDSLGASQGMWDAPPYPVDAFAQTLTQIPDSAVFPIGVHGIPVSQFTLTFDGLGNITLPDSISANPEYSGVLVKQ